MEKLNDITVSDFELLDLEDRVNFAQQSATLMLRAYVSGASKSLVFYRYSNFYILLIFDSRTSLVVEACCISLSNFLGWKAVANACKN